MTAFVTSLVVTAILVAIVFWYGKRREPGKPLTWGEAFVAAAYAFFLMMMLYAIVPNTWLQWADKDLKWRSDAVGLPTGPLSANFKWAIFEMKGHVFWPNGIPLANGHFIVTKQNARDIIVSIFYIVFGLGQIFTWRWWQRRGLVKAKTPELEASAYGRPLVRQA